MKNIALLGSTGSIGVNTLKVIRLHSDKYNLVGLGAGKNIDLLAQQIAEWHPSTVAVQDHEAASELEDRLPSRNRPKILFGTEGLIELATMSEIDMVVSAVSGAAGLLPTYEAVRAGKQVALANKETMVMAGYLVMAEAAKHDTRVLPIDSEHSAILQCLRGHPSEDVRRIILTASGGPFLGLSPTEMEKVTAAQALKHPNWDMGPKVTIDSATLMNKGLEAIEAKWLFDLPMEKIHILIHPQSIVHSMVEYNDGSIIAQLGIPDMMIPISYALAYPRHLPIVLPSLDLVKVQSLTFEQVDMEKFPCLALALRAAHMGGTMPAVLNAANEVAVSAFLENAISFMEIPRVIEQTMAYHRPVEVDKIETVLEADAWSRKKAKELIAQPL
ncbi:MAG: 1-deoxy-D-xylulose-5-phosphate reductoisomerase [Deltaproteobacteria bacterium]|nr:MAG: 1-deoxy-D-xylulose-5-phosphate reductoisomerase [Deltaproteobacteria bacterium]